MAMLDFLPKVNKCCFCCTLSCGAKFIAIFGILTAIGGLYEGIAVVPEPCALTGQRIFSWVISAASVAIGVASIVFLVGIYCKWPLAVDIFIIAAIISNVLVMITYIIITVIRSLAGCLFYYLQLILYVLSFALWVYFIIVVKSYKENHMNQNDID